MKPGMHWTGRSAKAGLRTLARFIWPQRSILSGERHAGDGAISPEDFARLHFLNGVGCARCAAEVE
ncbi:MAG: ComF family protein, partial [Alphaproteobacteria bacterium]|nr:ComF family protein [Alphaproteobacteria bacterium]